MGRQIEAQNILAQLLQAREKRYVSAPLIAAVYVALGDKEEAFQWLERASAEHSGILQWIVFLPEFRALHSDERFPQLLRANRRFAEHQFWRLPRQLCQRLPIRTPRRHLTLKIGVKPRPGTQNGHTVRISVSFYDLTRDNRMQPTNARSQL